MKVKHIKRVIVSVILLFAMSFTSVYATEKNDEKKQAQEQVENLQQQVEDAENALDDINDKKDELEDNLNDFNSELNTLVSDMNDLEEQIAAKQEAIATATENLETAEEQVEQQYEYMKRRIQYMYENGSLSMVARIIESESFSDFINKTEYIATIMQYDREKLVEFQELQTQIKEEKTRLEQEEASLLAMQEEMGKKRTQVNSLIASTQNDIEKTSNEVASAEAKVEDLEAQLAYWEAYEAKLDAERLQQDLELWEEIQGSGSGIVSGGSYAPAQGELYLLGAIIQCEAEGEPYAGKLAVGSVIMNRVNSSRFPNTITEVVYQKNQFSPVASGRLAYRLSAGVNDSCMQAAQEVLNGNITTNALFFRTVTPSISGTVIGNHVFY